MQLKLKESPKEWRKAVWMSSLGLAVMSSLLRWRHRLPTKGWVLILCLLAVLALAAALRPAWFRGYYRFSSRLGFRITKILGYIALALFFCIVMTPFGLILRLLGQDPLRLRRPANTESYWSEVRQKTPLDRLF